MGTVYTVGHSTRSLSAFLRLLQACEVEALADVRAWPSSKRHPHFDGERLAHALSDRGIEYVHLGGLGGFRKPRRDSVNTGIRSAGFRGYADHMATEEFQKDLERLLELAGRKRTAVMCAEALPWRCHRYFLSDTLAARGLRVVHILDEAQWRDHELHPLARVRGVRVIYPGDEAPP